MSTYRSSPRLRNLPLLLLCMALVASLGLLWQVRRTPLAWPFVYADALAALMLIVLCAGMALAYLVRSHTVPAIGLPGLVLVVLAALACLSAVPIVSALLLLLIASLLVAPHIRQPAVAMPLLLASLAALVAALGLTLRGILRYDDPAAGTALDSLVFWFTLLAAVIPALPLAISNQAHAERDGGLARLLFLYPLVRLFTLGPWNEGWSLAAMLLGGAAAGWAALATLTHPTAEARALAARRFFLGLALGALGLASSAGVAACCYALVTYALLCTLPNGIRLPNWVNWAQAGALPLTAPFMACWLAVGAAAASGASVLAGALWLAALLRGVALLLELPAETDADPRTGLPAGSALVVSGILAPPIVAYLIQPAVDQLQGGLTAYGNLSIAPWVGLSLLDSGNRVVTTAPTLAAAGLMLVLVALVFLLSRLWPRSQQPDSPPEQVPERSFVLAELIQAVPWLRAANSKKARDHDPR